MTKEQVIQQLENLREHCKEFSDENDDIFAKDVRALDFAIETIKGGEK